MYKPKPNSIEYPHIKIFIPFTKLQHATVISLIGYDYKPVKLDGENAYLNYFKDRWTEGKTFINIEHDVVVWPGALEALWDCPNELCAYNYHLPIHRLQTGGQLPIGCVKISDKFIAKSPNLWDQDIKWNKLDQLLMKSAHQHFPGVVNANEALLGFAEMEDN